MWLKTMFQRLQGGSIMKSINIKYATVNTVDIHTTKGTVTKTIIHVDVCDVPRDIPMDINPRKQKMSGTIVKDIKNSLINDEGMFMILNKGLTIIAKEQLFGDHMLTLNFNNNCGLIDGGHTYKCILDVVESGLVKRSHNYVTIEVLSGKGLEGYTIPISKARNSSVQVKNYSLTELDKGFEWIKKALIHEECLSNIVFKENDIGTVKVDQLVWLLAVTNPNIFPTQSYGTYIRRGKAMRLYNQEYKEHGFTIDNPFYGSLYILKDLIKVYDYIQCNYGLTYKGFLKLKPVKATSGKSEFLGNELKYRIPNQWLYPAVTAIRSIIMTNHDGYLQWIEDPFEWVEKALPELVEAQIKIYKASDLEQCRSGVTINRLYEIGKDNI